MSIILARIVIKFSFNVTKEDIHIYNDRTWNPTDPWNYLNSQMISNSLSLHVMFFT